MTSKELREAIAKNVMFAVQGVAEINSKDINDYYQKRADWINTEADEIMKLVYDLADNILSELQGKLPKWKDKAYYTKNPVLWKPVAPESNAEHYDAGFNEATEIIKQTIESMRNKND